LLATRAMAAERPYPPQLETLATTRLSVLVTHATVGPFLIYWWTYKYEVRVRTVMKCECNRSASAVQAQCKRSASAVQTQCKRSASAVQAQCKRSASAVQAQCKRSASAVQAQCKRSARAVQTGVQTRVGRVRVGVLGVRGGCRCVSGRARRGLRGLRAHHVPTRTLSPSPPRSHHPQSLCFESRAAHNGSPADPAVRGDATCLWRSASGTSPQRRGWWWGDAYNTGDRHTSAESGKGQTVVVG
jgi:hypothetical protein